MKHQADGGAIYTLSVSAEQRGVRQLHHGRPRARVRRDLPRRGQPVLAHHPERVLRRRRTSGCCSTTAWTSTPTATSRPSRITPPSSTAPTPPSPTTRPCDELRPAPREHRPQRRTRAEVPVPRPGPGAERAGGADRAGQAGRDSQLPDRRRPELAGGHATTSGSPDTRSSPTASWSARARNRTYASPDWWPARTTASP